MENAIILKYIDDKLIIHCDEFKAEIDKEDLSEAAVSVFTDLITYLGYDVVDITDLEA